MALLNSGIENLQQMPMPSAGMKSADPSILEQILGAAKSAAPYLLPGIALPAMAISDALDARSRNQQAMKDTQGMDYGQLAQYWAARDPEKAAKYAEIAQSQQPKGYGQTFTSGGRIYQLTTDAGKPVDLGPAPAEAPKFSISGGYITQNGIPVSELPMSARERAQEARANEQLALSRASAAREEARFRAEQSASTSTAAKVKGLPPVERSKVEAKANMYAMARKNIDRLSSIVRTADSVQLADPRSTVGAQAASLATQIQDAYRDMANLGVINEADVPRIENVVPGATSLPTIAKGKAAALEKYRVFAKELDQGLANLGYRVRKPANGESPMVDYSSKYGLKPRDGK